MSYVFVGLGNPVPEYENTRHNTGRSMVAALAKKAGVSEWREDKKSIATVGKEGKTVFLLPDTYMNRSGKAVLGYVKSKKMAEKLVVVYDDLDLPLGTIKISFNRSSGGHNGLKSVSQALKTDAFIRIRVGISPTTPSGNIKRPTGEEKVLKFILGKFTPKEMLELKKVTKRVIEIAQSISTNGYVHAMNEYN